jgi:hypothetical protein
MQEAGFFFMRRKIFFHAPENIFSCAGVASYGLGLANDSMEILRNI